MKTVQYIFLFLILGLLGILIYQNPVYFMTASALNLDLKISDWNWISPPLPNIVYLSVCFLVGLMMAGFKGFLSGFKLKKEIRKKESAIAALEGQIQSLKTELDVFKHDPYIKKEIEKTTEHAVETTEATQQEPTVPENPKD